MLTPVHRDPAALLERTLAQWRLHGADGAPQDLLLFAYGSLIWRPDFEFSAQRLAKVHGYHRSLRMRSRINRGCIEQPGLVLALLPGGSCRGLVYQVPAANGEAVLRTLWEREMVTGVYEPRWLPCITTDGAERALAFTLSRRSPSWTGDLADHELLHIFRHARGRYGTTLDYLMRTVLSLREHGIHDAELERQWRLAANDGLCAPPP